MSRGSLSPVRVFATHRVASNLLMFLLILAGAWGLKKLNTQFFPTFDLDVIAIQVAWRGASAEDVEQAITIPVEQELRSVDYIDALYSTSTQGLASLRLEIEEDAPFAEVLDEVKQRVDALRNLPADAEQPVVIQVTPYESIASILVTGGSHREELRPLVRAFERQLLERGIRRVDIAGLPEREVAIQVPAARLHELGLTLTGVADQVAARSRDLPAGTAGRDEGARQVRSLNQQRSEAGFANLPLLTQGDGRLLRLGDIATVELRPQDNQSYLEFRQQPAIELTLQRTASDDTLQAARVLEQWLAEVRPTLPAGVELTVYNERWLFLKERIGLLLRNGLGGLLLVIGTLFLFLNVRVAWWVTVGIPVSFLATLAILWLIGGSINMISLFGMIMALGIIVDDAIVVGEDTLTHVQQGEPGVHAAIGGAQRMLAPVLASSLTTISAFLPLLLVGGVIGNILIDIPTVVICVIIASLVECFLILPGHLHHSLKDRDHLHPGRLRIWLDGHFEAFRNHRFRRLVRAAITLRWVTLSAAIAAFVLALGLVAGGRVKFTFFPVVDGDVLTASVQFTAGTRADRVDRFLDEMEQALYAAQEELGVSVVASVVQYQRQSLFGRDRAESARGDEYGALYVQLIPGDQRALANSVLLQRWRERVPERPGVERLSISQQSGGPPGKPIEIKLTGGQAGTLKQASLALQEALKRFSGVSNVDDDLPYGQEQLIYRLSPAGDALGLSLEALGSQLRAALDGRLVQIYHQGDDEIEVRVLLPDRERNHLTTLEQLPIQLPGGGSTPLANVVEFHAQRGLDALKRVDGQLAIQVSADVDDSQANANEILDALQQDALQQISARYGIKASFEGKKADERKTLADMKLGLILALTLIYIILAWVFGAYSWPLAVMAAIPFGLSGAVFGHLVMGLDLTILSLFGLFGLSGIVINDSIVLITFYKKLRERGLAVHAAIEEAACQRLRAVLLTSLTTIAGLSPILFETSLQAQFLIPMATSIVFGLAFSTLLILLVVPALLCMLENLATARPLAPVRLRRSR